MIVFWVLLGFVLGAVCTALYYNKPTVVADAAVVRAELARIEIGFAGSLSRLHTRFDEVLSEIKKKAPETNVR
jgi:hypothetical protein